MPLLTERNKELIRETWPIVKERGDNNITEIGRAIFIRLFEVAPQTQALFPFRDETMEELKTSKKLGRHADNFMKKVILAIEGMDVLFGEVGPKLVSLGSRHYGFGVEAPNFAFAGQALVDVLEQVLAKEFTDEVKEAWINLYSLIQEALIEGTKDH